MPLRLAPGHWRQTVRRARYAVASIAPDLDDGRATTAGGRVLRESSERLAGNVVHFVFGALNGAWYAVAAERWPLVARGRGLLLGTLLWAGADEAALPALGLLAPPVRYPVPTHAEALATHLVYGLTTDTVRRLIRRTLS